MDPNFIQHLLDLTGPDPNKRRQAEQLKEQQLSQNFFQYLCSLTTALVTDSVEGIARQLAGIIIKNATSGPNEITKQQNQQAWRNIPANQRAEIKARLLTGLATTNGPARKGATFAVASVAVAELTVNEWVDLIPTLAHGIKQNNPIVQESALQTIGLICEDIDIIPDCLTAQSGEILNVIVYCAKPELPVEVRRASISAMYGALGIVSANFAKKDERDYIMQITCNACKDQDEAIQTYALRCLVKTAELYYEFLDIEYMRAIWQITSQIMTTDSASAPFTVEFWSTIAETERDIQDEAFDALEPSNYPEFAVKILPELVPRLCANLLKQVDDTADEDEWNIAAASAACIAILAECTQEKIISVIFPFIQKIKDSNWRQREASTMAFGSILTVRTTDSEQVVGMVGQVIGILLQHLAEDPNDCVRSTSAWAISKIAACHPVVITKDTKSVLVTLVAGLAHSDAVVAYYSCYGILQILSNIYEGRSEEATNDLSPLFLPLMAELIKAADREDSDQSKLRISAFEATNTLIEVCPIDCLEQVKSVIQSFLQKLENSFTVNMDKDEQKEVHAYISLVLQTITKRIGSQIAPVSQSIFNTLVKIFTVRKAIVDEALNAISTLFDADPNLVTSGSNLQSFITFFKEALRTAQDVSIFKSGLICLGSLCDALSQNLYLFDNGTLCDEIIALLAEHLRKPALDRSLRPLIITSFADIALAIGPHFAKYFEEFFKVFSAAADVAITPNEQNEDYIDYVIALREAVLEAIPPVMESMCLAKKQSMFIAGLSKIIHYMQLLWGDTDYRTRSIISCMIGIVGDLLENIVPAMEQQHAQVLIRMPFIHEMLQHGITKSTNPDTQQTARWAQSKLSAVRK